MACIAIREYRDLKPEDMSVVTSLDSRTIKNDYGKVSIWVLKHHTEGFELAGSCARHTNERWSVTTLDRTSGTTHGNAFLTLAAATCVFHSDKPWYKSDIATAMDRGLVGGSLQEVSNA
jgi:hypothetical protein